MSSRPTREGPAPYVTAVTEDILAMGPGGDGNHESALEASSRGVTRELADQAQARADALARERRAAAEHDALVRARAHAIWLEEGRPQGQAERHWHMAEQSLTAQVPAGQPQGTEPPPRDRQPGNRQPAKQRAPAARREPRKV